MGLKVLHAGCGSQPIHPTFAQYEEVRLDIDQSVNPDILASIVAMPQIEDQHFDAVYSAHTLEHLYLHEVPLALREFRRVLKPGGLLFLAVPVGKDKILFNNARIYGRLRLPLLTSGWTQLDAIGLHPDHLDGPGHIQPVFVLRNS